MILRKAAVLVCAVAFAGCDYQLDQVILWPSPTYRMTPADLKYVYEEKMLPMTAGGSVNIWHVHASKTSKGMVVIMPGNSVNKGLECILLPIFADKGWDVLLFDYPGFGKSTGTPSLDGVIASARTALDYAFDQDNVVVGFGASLGTGVLARVAGDYDMSACIFESTTNLWTMSSEFMKQYNLVPELSGFADLMVAAGTSPDYDIKRWIVDVKSPKLFLHSPEDSFVPWSEAWDIFKLAPQPRHIIATQGDHGLQIFQDPGMYRSMINGWLDGALKLDPITNPADFQKLLDNELQALRAEFGLAPTH